MRKVKLVVKARNAQYPEGQFKKLDDLISGGFYPEYASIN